MLVVAPAVDAAAEPLLDLRHDRAGLSPRAARPIVGRLGPKPGDLAGHVLLDAVARDCAHGSVPLRPGARAVRALAERLARPRRRRDDVALGELVEQLARLALQLALTAVERVALVAHRGQAAGRRCQAIALAVQRGQLTVGAVDGGCQASALGGVRV